MSNLTGVEFVVQEVFRLTSRRWPILWGIVKGGEIQPATPSWSFAAMAAESQARFLGLKWVLRPQAMKARLESCSEVRQRRSCSRQNPSRRG